MQLASNSEETINSVVCFVTNVTVVPSMLGLCLEIVCCFYVTDGLPEVLVVLEQRVVVLLHLGACHDGRSFQKLVTLHTLDCHLRNYTQRAKSHLLQSKRDEQ